jgi:hypothetical protein
MQTGRAWLRLPASVRTWEPHKKQPGGLRQRRKAQWSVQHIHKAHTSASLRARHLTAVCQPPAPTHPQPPRRSLAVSSLRQPRLFYTDPSARSAHICLPFVRCTLFLDVSCAPVPSALCGHRLAERRGTVWPTAAAAAAETGQRKASRTRTQHEQQGNTQKEHSNRSPHATFTMAAAAVLNPPDMVCAAERARHCLAARST